MFGTYHEQFVGSGALFVHLRWCGQRTVNVVLSDTNPRLIGLYTVVRDDVDALQDALLVHEPHHHSWRSCTKISPCRRSMAGAPLTVSALNGVGQRFEV